VTPRRSVAAAFAAGVATTLLVTALPAVRADTAAAPTDPLAAVRQAYDAITQDFAGTVDPKALVAGAIAGMAQATGDRFTQYFDPSQLTSFTGTLQGGFVGIGIVMGEGKDGYPQVLSVMPDGPADKAGVRADDEIIFVDGVTTVGQSLDEVAKRIRGALGTPVSLGLRRAGAADVMTVRIVRGNVNPSPSVTEQALPDGLAEIRISQFDSDTASLFTAALQAAEAMSPAGLILDLRDDPGGYLEQAVDVARQIVPAGPVVTVVDAHGNRQTFTASGDPHLPPLAVLVNANTASAAEILAGAIQARGAGVIVGTTTYGKGSVQEILDLSNGGALKLTIAHDFTPAGAPINGRGITPDIVVPPPPPPPAVPDFAAVGTRVLTEGMVGLDVLGVQQRLAYLGDDPGPQDGVYGQATDAAMARFAIAHDLRAPNGVISVDLQRALEGAVGEKVRQSLAPPTDDGILAAAEKYLLSRH
jgi:carboxyl-terminal processing protease